MYYVLMYVYKGLRCIYCHNSVLLEAGSRGPTRAVSKSN